MISLVGICWSVACWVPFAIIMEAGILSVLLDIPNVDGLTQFLKEMTERPPKPATSRPAPRRSVDERASLMQRECDTEADGTTVGEPSNESETKPLAGGTILGIHNLAIVMPQFIVCIIVSPVTAHPMSCIP